MNLSPYQQARRLGLAINRLAAAADLDAAPAAAQRSLDALKGNARAAQDVLKDYEMYQLEEDVRQQVRVLPRAVKSLEKLRESLLKASEYDLVGAVDVAQMSAELDELIIRLR